MLKVEIHILDLSTALRRVESGKDVSLATCPLFCSSALLFICMRAAKMAVLYIARAKVSMEKNFAAFFMSCCRRFVAGVLIPGVYFKSIRSQQSVRSIPTNYRYDLVIRLISSIIRDIDIINQMVFRINLLCSTIIYPLVWPMNLFSFFLDSCHRSKHAHVRCGIAMACEKAQNSIQLISLINHLSPTQ